MTVRNTWKAFERTVAGLFNTERTPLSGGNSKHTRSDTLSDKLFIECKYRANSATCNLFAETEKLAAKEGKIPVLALKAKGKNGFLVVIRPNHLQIVTKYLKGENK